MAIPTSQGCQEAISNARLRRDSGHPVKQLEEEYVLDPTQKIIVTVKKL
jgi:hypothetical protein